ncbi:hypothetical protein [Salaquimonas pukyongi]|uniref:hypothetical protein n=1 Tax=Salaquimonas pukyongi TaxID=2712698 RepID=UPI00096B93B0|nr:hypothetical protein [Salaquimonas pukyongi]
MEQLSDLTLEEKILREKQLVAETHLLEAWEAGLEDGIEPEILARTIVVKTLDQLSRSRGHEAAGALVSEISELESEGHFVQRKTLQ